MWQWCIIFIHAAAMYALLLLWYRKNRVSVSLPLLLDWSGSLLFFFSFTGVSQEIWQFVFYGTIVADCLLYGLLWNWKQQSCADWFGDCARYNRPLYLRLTLWPALAGVLVQLLLTAAAFHTDFPIWQRVPAAILSFVCPLVVIWLRYFLFISQKEHEELEQMRQWQADARDYMNTIRAQRHDFNLHLHAISGLVSNGEFNECEQYVRKLAMDAAAVNDIMPVYDAVIGSMLSNMRKKTQTIGSDIHYDITCDMKDIVCNAFECNKIIGNLLQNALDALSTQQEKNYGIRVSIFKRRGNTVISVSNYYEGDVSHLPHAFELNYSGKKKHEGIGLAMTEKTLQRYGGRIYMEMDDRVITFFVNIPNRISLEASDHTDRLAGTTP